MRIQDYLLGLLIVAVVACVVLFCRTWITELAKWTFEKIFKKGPSATSSSKQTTVSASDGSSVISESPGAVSAPQSQEVGEGGKAIQAGPGAYVSDQSGSFNQAGNVNYVAPGGNLTIINNTRPSEEYEKSLNSLKIQLEAEKKEFLELLYDKGYAATKQGEYEDALEFFKRAASKGDTPVLRLALSSTYFSLSRLEKAIEEADKALDQLSALPPTEGRKRLRANVLSAKGSTLYISANLSGSFNADTLVSALVVQHGQHQKAESCYLEALHILRKLAPKSSSLCELDLAMVLGNLGIVVSALGRKTEAEGYLNEALDILYNCKDDNSSRRESYLISTLNSLSNLVSSLGRRAEAEGYLKKALEISGKLADKDPMYEPEKAMVLYNLNFVSISGPEVKAEYLKEVLEICQRHAEQRPLEYLMSYSVTADILVGLYTEIKRPDEAAKYRKMAEAAKAKHKKLQSEGSRPRKGANQFQA